MNKELATVVNCKIDTLPFISTAGTIDGFLPKSMTINVKQDSSKQLETVEKILVNGITKEECTSHAGVTSVSNNTVYYPKCVSTLGTYNFVFSYDKPYDKPEGAKERGTSGVGISATKIGIIVAVAVAVIIIVVIVDVIKRRKNRKFNSSDGSDSM